MAITPRKTATTANTANTLSDSEREARARAFIEGAPDGKQSKARARTVRVPGTDGRPGGIARLDANGQAVLGDDGKPVLSRSTVMISMHPDSLDELDALAAKLRMSRSALIVMLVHQAARAEGVAS
jgi:hypothetical protein